MLSNRRQFNSIISSKPQHSSSLKHKMQFMSLFILSTSIYLVKSAPTQEQNEQSVVDSSMTHAGSQRYAKDRKSLDYYEYRHVVADGVQKALDECRQKFKWDRWNCPKKAFLSILDREEFATGQITLPSNKELGLTRALIASGIVLSMIKSCSIGTNSMCSCTNPTVVPVTQGVTDQLYPVPIGGGSMTITSGNGHHDMMFNQPDPLHQIDRKKREAADELATSLSETMQAVNSNIAVVGQQDTHEQAKNAKFAWAGCDEIVKFGFKIAKMYLDSQDKDKDQGEPSRLINAHNYEVGRQAVKKSMKRKCKCHGTSGTCQVNTCWTVVPDMSEVGDYLKRQYRVAAKVGASTAKDSDATSLIKELSTISPEKLVFADASPDYCYENKQLGINGTLGRYCSRAKQRHNGTEVSRYERDSCDRLCTKCGYKIHRERINVEKQCDCRFVYCCSVECKRCPHVEETYKCVRHS